MAPHLKGRQFYSDDMRGFNFSRSKATITESHRQSCSALRQVRQSSIARRAERADRRLPAAVRRRESVTGARSVGATADLAWQRRHDADPFRRIEQCHACVVAGTRRFTLFPPEQIANLYVGPLGHAPTGTPISLASLANPDFKQFPRLREALCECLRRRARAGRRALIPALWWHHVESLAKYNILVNYWWKGNPEAVTNADTALNCLLHCLLTLQQLPRARRDAWRVTFRPLHFQCRCRVVRLHTRACSRRAG